MNTEYDAKFEEMKKYVPFLENMIKRLESTSSDCNPRQAQLNKIRSLRDLLLDKKKRMKMENLLKCEQVLVNLYSKVEQRDALPGSNNCDIPKNEKTDLNIVRNKIKSVVTKPQQDTIETLPEIARASETEEVCVPGSKEPALFQRRPNIPSVTQSPSSRSNEPLVKRNYTRVLLSPESSEKCWSNEVSSSEKLFSRRSPKKSPRKRSPTYKKERKKSKSKLKYMHSNDLNITLNVPEDSLNSLNTKDILSRIINCSDSDVDIATLRELRTQILGELKETGTNEDISDIILKSYKNKSKRSGNTKEIEEGELSDSESEAIESIYGSLVVLDKNNSACVETKNSDKETQRKIQICLVINSDKTKQGTIEESVDVSCSDSPDFQTFDNQNFEKINKEPVLVNNPISQQHCDERINKEKSVITVKRDVGNKKKITENFDNVNDKRKADITQSTSIQSETDQTVAECDRSKVMEASKPVLLAPVEELKQVETKDECAENSEADLQSGTIVNVDHALTIDVQKTSKTKLDVEIPLLESTKQVSEIDILQALKKEILNETTNVLKTDTELSVSNTPHLHQPKVTKVVNAQEIGCKKRISIESYKAKSNISSINRLNKDKTNKVVKEDSMKKQSLKLTEKECERFNFLSKLILTESSDDEDRLSLSLDDIHTDLAPKSPDHDDFADTGIKPPVIIPSDPVQTAIVSSESDVDMRKLLLNVKPSDSSNESIYSPLTVEKKQPLNIDKEINKCNERIMPLMDPRMKRDINTGPGQETLNAQSINLDKTQRSLQNFMSIPVINNVNVDLSPAYVQDNLTKHTSPLHALSMSTNVALNITSNTTQNIAPTMASPVMPNMTPNRKQNTVQSIALNKPKIPSLMTPNRTSNIANMTPSRMPNMTPNMTPSRYSFDNEDYSNQKHVYAPMFSALDSRDGIDNSRDMHQKQWDTSESRSPFWEDLNPRNNSVKCDIDYREQRNCFMPKDAKYKDQIGNTTQRDADYRDLRNLSVHRDGDYKNRQKSTQSFQSFESGDCDNIQFPNSSTLTFGRLDCPATPTPSFGRIERPMTPAHPFSRSDCPLTPSHPFGREPLPPVPPTFMRSEYNSVIGNTVSRSQDPRLNRNADIDSNQYRDDTRERSYCQERQFNSGSYNMDQSNRHNNPELFRRFRHEQSVGRNERNKNYESISSRNYRDQMSRRESSVSSESRDGSRSFIRDYEGDRYSRHRNTCARGFDYRSRNDSKCYDEGSGRRNYRQERSVGRTNIGINDRKHCSSFSEGNKLSSQSHGGHDVMINSRPCSNLQDNKNLNSSSSFDIRKQRASSVGRTLVSDASKISPETKQICNDAKNNREHAKNFRRASSAGREIEYDNKRDFRDIKADLKSFTFKSDFKFSKSIKKDLTHTSTECAKSDSIHDKKKTGENFDKSKYSPRKNNRDPRMSRKYSRDNNDHRSSSRESKNYGIVYSNDNISKGTILGSGYGVKNYKIPKIKRPQESMNANKTDTPDIDEENKSSSKIKQFKTTKQTDFSTFIETKSKQKFEKMVDEIDDVSKSCPSIEIENLINNDNKFQMNDNNKQHKEKTEEHMCSKLKVATVTNECENGLNENKPISLTKNKKARVVQNAINNNTNEVTEDDNCKAQTNKIELKTTFVVLRHLPDDIGRRLTRSARKSMQDRAMSLDTLETLPIKRTKKGRKPFVLESDSADNDLSATKSKSYNDVQSQKLAQDNSAIENSTIEDSKTLNEAVDNATDSNEKDILIEQQNLLLDNDSEPAFLVLESDKLVGNDIKSNVLHTANKEKPIIDSTERGAPDLKSVVLEESQTENKEDLDTNFGIGDVEMFTDNITSDPVVENINALIADLDHDLDSSRISSSVEANSQFTNEINLDIMLENLSSADKNDEIGMQLLLEHKVNMSNDFSNKSEITPFADKHINTNNSVLTDVNNDVSDSKIGYDNSENETEQGISNLECNIISTPMKEDNIADSVDKSKIISYPQQSFNICGKQVTEMSKADVPEICSNEAIVSTSDDGIIYKPEITLKSVSNIETGDKPSTPDSTITSNTSIDEEQTQSLALNQTESNSEMNLDITSTHSVDTASKSSLETLTDIGASAQIESIGKLLSLLQDKLKIKKLLSILGGQNENEKIKKKLEKLSEIVSDDETTVEVKDTECTDCDLDSSKSTVASEKEERTLSTVNPDIQHIQEKYSKSADSDFKIPIQNDGEGGVECLNSKENTADASDDDQLFNNKKSNNESEINNRPEIAQENLAIIKNTSEADSAKVEKFKRTEDIELNLPIENKMLIAKKTVPKKKATRKGKRRNANTKIACDVKSKRLTRSDTTSLQISNILDKPVIKKPSRELQKLQEDIREMFLKDDILSTTGIRMCRIAKLVDEKKTKDVLLHETNSQEPVVVLKNCIESNISSEKIQKKKLLKNKSKLSDPNTFDEFSDVESELKMKEQNTLDPYHFENDLNEHDNENNNKHDSSSESECDSVCSSKSFESMELTETKKKIKRKRGKGWKAGVIKPKNKKKKLNEKPVTSTSTRDSGESCSDKAPDFTCFTDRNYCFRKNVWSYKCRLCLYNGTDIVRHYKEEHPHTEVPLSRMSVSVANGAIKESEDANFQVIRNLSSKKYICRFCFKEFGRKKRLLETFFWHIVSTHTGEYKKTCSKCVDTQSCPLDIDIPPPPKDNKGQLLGYICEKCNYTQISLENLKTHVIFWHNDEQTAVYTINLAIMSKAAKTQLLKSSDLSGLDKTRVLRSSRSYQSMAEATDEESNSGEELNKSLKDIVLNNKSNDTDSTKIKTTRNILSKITFENDITDEMSHFETAGSIKVEPVPKVTSNDLSDKSRRETDKPIDESKNCKNIEKAIDSDVSEDIFDYPHFKIKYSESGSKEYVCCINGKDYHYKTTLLISMKKHVQLKHFEKWDGYCWFCKVIVTPQGDYKFKDCLQHFIDKHLDNFPTLENDTQQQILESNRTVVTEDSDKTLLNKSYINVRPLSELISKSSASKPPEDKRPALPVIESIISLGAKQLNLSQSYPSQIKNNLEVLKQYKYEEYQAEIMLRKHRVVLDGMMSQNKLVQVFKCAGRFCSFTTDNAEHALLHASTHMRVGGLDSLNCIYCDFDSCGNAIDLITHVFKYHGCCPYVCGMCFYRATTSHLVSAHITRLHETAKNVKILKTSFQTAPIQENNILSRESAVSHYLCSDTSGGTEGSCKFRTYIPEKFYEHMKMRHASATEHQCFICEAIVTTPADLICHLKIHGLKLYQCTWCVFGADNKTELLEHASALHPSRQPKAYLRIITNKKDSSEYKVLPLAQWNESNVPAIEVIPTNQQEYPVREAERSIELEKLIGDTTLMIDSKVMPTEAGPSGKEQIAEMKSDFRSNGSMPKRVSTLDTSETQIPRITTPTQLLDINNQSNNHTTPIIKDEVLLTPEKILRPDLDVVCLDSDDESDNQNAQSISIVKTTASTQQAPVVKEIKKVRLAELFLCPRCKMTVKCGSGFKKHINACFAFTSDAITCVHCSMSLTRKNIVTHYNTHCDRTKEVLRYFCQKCSLGFSTIAQVRDHQLTNHNISTSDGSSLPTFIKEVTPTSKGRKKRSLENREKAPIEPPEKIKRYGPEDINKLPINPILDDSVVCSLCEFNTKVRLNMVRHLQLHAQQQPVPQTAPVNPVPHLETNEKHFDKMVNLASSSVVTKPPDKNKSDGSIPVTLSVPPDTVSRYPKYVPDKQRLTCGAKECSYISVDETMLKCHWETLHYGSNDFHCVHCPSYQQLDTSKPVTAARIIAHLKMHDEKLYACSLCPYYHYRRQILEKHLVEVHKSGQVLIVRENKAGDSNSLLTSISQIKASAPTMDLKSWQCGLCKFKSLLRPEVVEHCAKVHNSKMQFKCAYCAFRTSNVENVTKHLSKSHTGKPSEIFYFYYRDDSVPDDPDGTARWQKQSQNCVTSEPKVKTENISEISSSSTVEKVLPSTKSVFLHVNLDLVKKESVEPIQDSVEDLCKVFGEFCEPNGLKYKCTLCSNVIEDSLEAMQSHLYEELKYRKWGCSICSYKAFHKEGLHEHMLTEHRQNRDPIALPADNRIETWVAKLLEHQTSLIAQYKENLAKQKVEILRVNPGPSTSSKPQPQVAKESSSINPSAMSTPERPNIAELEKMFGAFGLSVNMLFCCPKCDSSFKEEELMHNHLESELNKIRWFCNNCSLNFQTYHEAQFHCRSVHIGQGARPVEAPRDATVRSAWIDAVIQAQKLTIHVAPCSTKTEESSNKAINVCDNSLLVVRYEENIPTPEEDMARTTPVPVVDSDDEKLIIDEPIENRIVKPSHNCPHCSYVAVSAKTLRDHILRHYGLKPFTCPYCGLNGARKTIEKHQKTMHPSKSINLMKTTIPSDPPYEYSKKFLHAPGESVKVVCLVCRNYFTEIESLTHAHDRIPTTFGKKGEVVVQCSFCFTLHKDVNAYMHHHKMNHSELGVNYVFSKLTTLSIESKEMMYACSNCSQKFSHLKDLKTHSDLNHQSLFRYTLVPKHNIPIIDLDDYEELSENVKRKNDDDSHLPTTKRTARKSTTKLPNSRQYARKSTTKLPLNIPNQHEKLSLYGTASSDDDLEVGVVTMMPFYNKMVPFNVKRLREVININPVVRVKKIDVDS